MRTERQSEWFPCPCCGHLVFGEPPGCYEICPICFWEDDIMQLRYPDLGGGANRPSLIEAQANFRRVGACEERLLAHVRKPQDGDVREKCWRLFNPESDQIESRSGTKGYVASAFQNDYPEDPTSLYYWCSTFWRRGAEP
jgi:hypothetical protein